MNHQNLSTVFFEETYCVPAHQVARSLFTHLPIGSGFEERVVGCLATGYLVAIFEAACTLQMRPHIDEAREVVLGQAVQIEHQAPVLPGTMLQVRG